MTEYLAWKIECNSEAGAVDVALQYKWLRFLSDDVTRRKNMLDALDSLHQKTYKSKTLVEGD